MQHPELTFEHVIGRGSTVAIGVPEPRVDAARHARCPRKTRSAGDAHHGRRRAGHRRAAQRPAAAAADDKRHALFAGIYGIDDLLALGKAESEDLAQRAAAVRHGMASLFGALVGGTAAAGRTAPARKRSRRCSRVSRPRGEPPPTRWVKPGGAAHALARLADARESLRVALDGIALGDPRDEAALLIAGERLIEQIDDYCAALDGLVELQRPRPGYRPARVRFHRDTGRPCATACARPARSRSPVRSGSSPAGTSDT